MDWTACSRPWRPPELEPTAFGRKRHYLAGRHRRQSAADDTTWTPLNARWVLNAGTWNSPPPLEVEDEGQQIVTLTALYYRLAKVSAIAQGTVDDWRHKME